MPNNLSQLKKDILAALNKNLDAATKTKVANAFVASYPREWLEFTQQQGNPDTPANRMIFTTGLAFKFFLTTLDNVTRDFETKEAISQIRSTSGIGIKEADIV